jgi:carbon-monoxide dehydrogenase iron sulfur subunit
MACIAAHHGITIKEAMKLRDELVSRVHVIKTDTFKASVRCRQCLDAPCASICPTDALRLEDHGIVVCVQYCVACKMCIAACPYGAMALANLSMPGVTGDNTETIAQRTRREVAVRCDMCEVWREENGKKITACMEACPARALSMVEPDGTVILASVPEPKAAAAPETAEKKTASEAVETEPQIADKTTALRSSPNPVVKAPEKKSNFAKGRKI